MYLKNKIYILYFIICIILCIIIITLLNKIINKNELTLKTKKIYNIHKIIIITTPLIKSIAINMSKFFNDFGFTTEIRYDLSEKECIDSTENELYIFVNTTMLNHSALPKIYILYQLEQSKSKWFTNKYYNYLNKADNIWEFSIKNRILYDDIPINKIFYQVTPYYIDNKPDSNIEYDVFFYGAKNYRRKKILDRLSKIFNIKIGFGIVGDDVNDIISKSKIILNIHYYDDCALEACRLNEILQYNKVIISEKSSELDWYNQSIYSDIVDFVDVINNDLSNIDNLISKIHYYLNETNYNDKIISIKQNKILLHNISKCNLYKNLFNIHYFNNPDNYLLDYDLKPDKIYCLHLIETPNRMNEFIKQNIMYNIKDIEIFPAIKYDPGWKGCALSYINLIYNAKRLNFSTITICEDDCRLPHDFNKKYNIIKEFLSKIKWDIFVGVIADLPKDTTVSNIYQYKNIKFIEINKMHSAVFNVYNNSVYDTVINWKKYIHESNDPNDQIDQYIKKQNLKIITTYPFYFDCVDANSTIWGKNLYAEYNNMFKKSLDILENKIYNYNGPIINII